MFQNILGADVTTERYSRIGVSELVLGHLLTNQCEMVSLVIKQPGMFDFMPSALTVTLSANFGLELLLACYSWILANIAGASNYTL